MNEQPLPLEIWQVAIAALLILVNGGISVALRLKLERLLLLAAARTCAQLLLLGWVLRYVFAANEWYYVVPVMLLMTLVAGRVAVKQSTRRFRGIWLNGLVSMWVSSWLVAAIALLVIVQVKPWYQPQYAIPFLGMILGNTLNGISLGLARFTDDLATRRTEVETMLCLGATRWEAARPHVQQALRTGMTPILNSMMVVGIVSMPGMMTGQLLAGADPVNAVKYQIVIMFLIASGTALGTMLAVLLSYLRLFSPRHQFLFAEMKTGTKSQKTNNK